MASTGWLTQIGDYKVERIDVPHTLVRCDATKPPAGVGHTTEGGWSGSLGVFKQHFAPNFMIGRNDSGKVTIAQMVPIGFMAAALNNEEGGKETNRWARVQFELVGFSSLEDWLPGDEVQHALAQFFKSMKANAGIPMSRPFPDSLESRTWATETNPRRISGKWGNTPGWFNHLEVPENDHWDMGAFQWREVFAQANAKKLVGKRVTYHTQKGEKRTVQPRRPRLFVLRHWKNTEYGAMRITRVFEK